jgi:hypothetical protein
LFVVVELVMSPDPEDMLLDKKLLSAMRASVNAARDIAHRSLELIEQSRIMLRELNIRGIDGRPIS